MKITDLIAPERVINGLRAGDKIQLLGEFARRASAAVGIDAQVILDALLAREALGSTGVGQGVAMPHARVSSLKTFFALFVKLKQPIDFASIDERKVDLVFLLLTPAEAGNEHLAALACASRQLRDRTLAARMRRANDDVALYQLLTGADGSARVAGEPYGAHVK